MTCRSTGHITGAGADRWKNYDHDRSAMGGILSHRPCLGTRPASPVGPASRCAGGSAQSGGTTFSCKQLTGGRGRQQRKFSRFPSPPAHNAAMRKRVYIALAVVLVGLAGVTVWQVIRASREREPVPVGQLKASQMLPEEPEDSDGSSGQIVGAFGIKLGQRFDPSHATFTNWSKESMSTKGEWVQIKLPFYGFKPKNPLSEFNNYHVVVTPLSNIVCSIGAGGRFMSAASALAEYRKILTALQEQHGKATFLSPKDMQAATIQQNRREVRLGCILWTNLSSLTVCYEDNALMHQAKWEQMQIERESPEMSEDVQEHVTGIGVALGVEGQTIKIMKVLPHAPASQAGLVPGLVVREIDGTPTEGRLLKECVDMVRGAAGTKVRLELVDIENSKTNTVELTRERIL